MKTSDLKKHALQLLELSRKFLAEDHDLDPTAFIITAEGQQLMPIELQDQRSKMLSCEKIVAEARARHAVAIITIFLARFKDLDQAEFSPEDYSWGDVQEHSSERCILLTLSGPTLQSWVVSLPFTLDGNRVIFRKQIQFKEGVDLGLFPSWPSGSHELNIS